MAQEFWIDDDGLLDGVFMRCASPPPAFLWAFGEPVAAFEALGRIKRVCAEDAGGDCLQSVLDYVDVTGDGRITPAEMSRVFRGLDFFVSHAIAQKGLVPVNDLAAAAAGAAILAPFLSSALLTNADYDNDGALTLDELLQDRGDVDTLSAAAASLEPAATQLAIQALLQALGPILGLLGGLLR